MRGRTKCYYCILQEQRLKKLASLTKKKERKLKTKKYQQSERKKLWNKAWEAQKQFLRKRDKNFQDLIECYCCGKLIPEKETEQMHRYHNKLDFDLRNIHLGCNRCNCWLHGNLGAYERHLVIDLGIEGSRQLEQDSLQHKGYSIEDLSKIIDNYKRWA